MIEAFSILYPNMPAKIYWTDEQGMKDMGEPKALGATCFDTKGKEIPEIFIIHNQTVSQYLDILAHELAHVAAGAVNEHNEVWQTAYESIYKKYHELFNDFEE